MTLVFDSSSHDPFMAHHPYRQPPTSFQRAFPLSPTDLGIGRSSTPLLEQQQQQGGWISFSDVYSYNCPSYRPTPSRSQTQPQPTRRRSPSPSSRPPIPRPPRRRSSLLATPESPKAQLTSSSTSTTTSFTFSSSTFRPRHTTPHNTHHHHHKRDPDLYKQVLKTCFIMSPAGHKSKLMGHRMAVRLWEANRELEKLVDLHSDVLYSSDEEGGGGVVASLTPTPTPPPTPREEVPPKLTKPELSKATSFLTFSDDADYLESQPPSRPRLSEARAISCY